MLVVSNQNMLQQLCAKEPAEAEKQESTRCQWNAAVGVLEHVYDVFLQGCSDKALFTGT
jgi:hypothetical protein